MNQKTGKEIKLDLYKNYKIAFGSLTNRNPKSLFISISSWGKPVSDEAINYNKLIRDLTKSIKQLIYNKLYNTQIDFIKERTIVDLDMRESGIRFGKKSFINCEITLFLKSDIIITSEATKNKIIELTKLIVDNTLESNKHFSFHKKKKEYSI
jgi:hypothetical protein